MFKPLLIFVSLVLCLNSPHAKELKGSDIGVDQTQELSAWDIEKQNLLSPFTTNAAWILGAGALLTYIVYEDVRKTDEFGYTDDHYETKNGTWTYYGNLIGWGVLQAGYTLTQLPGIYRGEERALNNTEMMWKSTIYTSTATLALKLSTVEQRRAIEHKFDSFPSGHASAAFAFATNVAMRHEWYWNFVSVPLALLVTVSRIEDDSHYVHDSIFGAALGTAFAYGMNTIDAPYLFSFAPKDDGGGIIMRYKF